MSKEKKQGPKGVFTLNPLSGEDYTPWKPISEMSKEELLLHLQIKKLQVRLNFEKLQSSISYTGMLIEAFQSLGLKEWLLGLLEQQAFQDPDPKS
ncbi:hypothetical protein EHQ27_11035 [Leptospira wolffii]|uniref:Uncharacterized protein n=1 Tax=Leptospira wolffii TaxID=409998 RepID=A0A2M9ZC51_9LEPT|nr:hypothetical protein [Leptospira wolffii]PJZ66013.1 hypothetical protein CH371_10865 [Leptospira wolffii]TGK59259.1 hypothetical protein EHQ32_10735 [Leptospira wolffii]TGK71092.1 hypothetical protein EHQ27_11035 [Leptospira wolffii]TGK71359.1 hypothetical protein EHQ35_14610 [Leptospira wolffii]TGL29364.1 hypothetical protein EHQ57_10545 [Leptospira wolffii]